MILVAVFDGEPYSTPSGWGGTVLRSDRGRGDAAGIQRGVAVGRGVGEMTRLASIFFAVAHCVALSRAHLDGLKLRAIAAPIVAQAPVAPPDLVVAVPLAASAATPTAPFTSADLPAPWSCIAFRESTDNLRAVNPVSGDQGAFQFALATWAEYAPAGYPAEPIGATLRQQFDVALLLWQADGFSPWETASLCSGTGVAP